MTLRLETALFASFMTTHRILQRQAFRKGHLEPGDFEGKGQQTEMSFKLMRQLPQGPEVRARPGSFPCLKPLAESIKASV